MTITHIKSDAGFTLIELMVVCMILAILAAVAMPAYNNYSRRAYVAEAVNFATNEKDKVQEYYIMNDELPTASQLKIESLSNKRVRSVRWDGEKIVITFIGTEFKSNSDISMLLVPKDVERDGHLTWTCARGQVNIDMVPSLCKN